MAGFLTPPPSPADPVSAELRRWASSPFDAARDNCGLAVLAYVERVCGQALSPALPARSYLAARLAILRAGGFAAYAGAIMARMGCPATDRPRRGDVALADLPSGEAAVIVLGDGMVAARGDHRVVICPATPTAAWRVSCPRR